MVEETPSIWTVSISKEEFSFKCTMVWGFKILSPVPEPSP